MRVSMSEPAHPSGAHIVLHVGPSEVDIVEHVIQEEILAGHPDVGIARERVEGVAPKWKFRMHKRFLDVLMLAFPTADLSPSIQRKMRKAAEKQIKDMPVPKLNLRKIMKVRARKELTGYQKIGIEKIIKREIELLNDEPGLGKALAHGTPVLTPFGEVPVEEITLGDVVVGSDGDFHNVTGVFPQGVRQCFRVTFNDGAWVDVDGDHLWNIQHIRNGWRDPENWRTETTDWIRQNLRDPSGALRWKIPMVSPVRGSDRRLPVDPYLLGVLLGDGGLTRNTPMLSTTDQEILDEVSLRLPEGCGVGKFDDLCTYSIVGPGRPAVNPLTDRLRRLGLWKRGSHDKFVPAIYKTASPEVRLTLLRGLMDTDGFSGKDGTNEFCSVSETLANDVRWLAQSLGGTARGGVKILPDGSRAWRVNVKMMECPFLMKRKAEAWISPTKYPPSRAIKSIEPVGKMKATCIAVDSRDHCFVVKDCIVTHNTRQALAAAAMRKRFPMLVVCPNNAKFEWLKQAKRDFVGLKVAIIDAGEQTKVQRQAIIRSTLDGHYDILVVNFEAIRAAPIHSSQSKYSRIEGWDYANPALFSRKWKFIVIDEHHRVKTPEAQVTRGFFQLRSRFWLMMSGTPLLNAPEEIWSVLWKLHPDRVDEYDDFKKSLCITKPSATEDRVVAYRPAAMAELREFISDISLRRRQDQVLDQLPPVFHVPRSIELNVEQRRLYKKIAEEWLLESEDRKDRPIVSMLAQITRLKQACFSPELYGGGKHSAKLDQLFEDINMLVANKEKVIIFSQWSKATRIMEREIRKKYGPKFYSYVDGTVKPRDRVPQQDKFMEDPECYCYLGTIGANREAINLGVATYVIFTDIDWSPKGKDQAIGRSAAGGLRGLNVREGLKVHVLEYQAANTIEQHLVRFMDQKRAVVDRTTDRDGGKAIHRVTAGDLMKVLKADAMGLKK